jgi:hypothetical protein
VLSGFFESARAILPSCRLRWIERASSVLSDEPEDLALAYLLPTIFIAVPTMK